MYGKELNVGIGFATGRKIFQKLLSTYVYNWKEHGLTENERVRLNLFVAYDLSYSNTNVTDYTGVSTRVMNLVDDARFIGSTAIRRDMEKLIREGIISEKEARLLFGRGYAAKRNAVLLEAIKCGMDYLIFLDDDEYPVAVTKTRATAVWGGQNVLPTHLKFLREADITNGHHCGYISPIPYIEFNSVLSEEDLRLFIEAISNDIINWNKIKSVMDNGGITWADTGILTSDEAQEVGEINGAKFISGANLGINLKDTTRVLPFYNPPGARGEDTFLSTCLTDHKVLRVPVYTFHDGFSTYHHLMDGVLPTKLKYIRADSEAIVERFYRACIGWVRYKPLLLYITQRAHYKEKIAQMNEKLEATLPKVCRYFGKLSFMNVLSELKKYDRNVESHYSQFQGTQKAFSKAADYYANERARRKGME